MAVRVSINGRITGPDEAVISVFDRGFLFGDSVYETLRTYEGRPMDLWPHLERLERSARALELPVPSREVQREVIAETLATSGNPESRIRVIVTRGRGELELATDLLEEPTHIVMVQPLVLPPEEYYQKGTTLAVVGVPRIPRRAVLPLIKSGNCLNNIMALAEARRSGAYEAIMLDASGRVVEGSTSNVFAVRAGKVQTPALEVGLLDGITRRRVFELAKRAGIVVAEAELFPEDLYQAEEIFITSSVRGIMPIAEISGHRPNLGAPGPITARISELYYSQHVAGRR